VLLITYDLLTYFFLHVTCSEIINGSERLQSKNGTAGLLHVFRSTSREEFSPGFGNHQTAYTFRDVLWNIDVTNKHTRLSERICCSSVSRLNVWFTGDTSNGKCLRAIVQTRVQCLIDDHSRADISPICTDLNDP
jgi:hypothetical protein